MRTLQLYSPFRMKSHFPKIRCAFDSPFVISMNYALVSRSLCLFFARTFLMLMNRRQIGSIGTLTTTTVRDENPANTGGVAIGEIVAKPAQHQPVGCSLLLSTSCVYLRAWKILRAAVSLVRRWRWWRFERDCRGTRTPGQQTHSHT